MKESELDFLAALGTALKELNKVPGLMIKTSKDKVKIALRSTTEPGITFGQWAVVTVTPSEFAMIVDICKSALSKNYKIIKSDKPQRQSK